MTKMTQSLISRISFRAAMVFLGALFCGFAVTAQSIVEMQPTTGVSVDPTRKSPVGLTSSTIEDNGGLSTGGYVVKQTAEVGGRIADFSGNELMWDTLVNLGSGMRLLEYSLNLHSPTHNGLLFDDLSFSNFGYGGDPNDLTRLRFSKGKIYNFEGNFRRDRNVFDYHLLANPLNPATSVPDVPILDSPHQLFLTRRRSDYNLNLFPLSIVRFRLGYSHNIQGSTAFSSVHEGTEAQLAQPPLDITDNYHFGISLRALPRTSLNFDQFYTFTKGDSASTLFALPYNLAGAQPIPVDLGLSINTAAGQPCATPILGTGFVNPACNACTRISPRHLQRCRLRTTYKPVNWVNLSGGITILENRNTALDIGNLQHNRSYSSAAEFAPQEAKWGVDLSYDYNDIFSQTNICHVATPSPPGALSCSAPFLSGISLYAEKSHFGSGSQCLCGRCVSGQPHCVIQ
jgi:hypothetical protein